MMVCQGKPVAIAGTCLIESTAELVDAFLRGYAVHVVRENSWRPLHWHRITTLAEAQEALCSDPHVYRLYELESH